MPLKSWEKQRRQAGCLCVHASGQQRLSAAAADGLQRAILRLHGGLSALT